MTCGRDAADKGGGNKQDGCGEKFNWQKAQAYVRGGGDKANLPKSIKDVDPNAAGEITHHLKLIHQGSSDTHDDLTINCDVSVFMCVFFVHTVNARASFFLSLSLCNSLILTIVLLYYISLYI
jgi:hypothetical protein